MEVALQTFTVRNEAKEDLKSTLKKVKDIGYSSVELSRVDFSEENAKIINEVGIKALSLQIKFEKLKYHFDDVVAFCKKVNCQIVEVSVMRYRCMVFPFTLKKFCQELNELSQKYAKFGLTLAYHHHDFEFKKIGNELKLDYILRNTKDVFIVSDTYWSKKSGYEPDEVLKKIGKRLIAVHLRDLAVKNNNEVCDCEVGSGIIDFQKVFAFKEVARYFAVEQNSATPFESVEKSYKYIANNLLKK